MSARVRTVDPVAHVETRPRSHRRPGLDPPAQFRRVHPCPGEYLHGAALPVGGESGQEIDTPGAGLAAPLGPSSAPWIAATADGEYPEVSTCGARTTGTAPESSTEPCQRSPYPMLRCTR